MKNWQSKKILFLMICASALMIAAHLLMQYLSLEIYNEKNGVVFELANRVDMDDEISIPTWFSQISLFVTAFFAYMSGRLTKKNIEKTLWYIFGGVLLLFSLDEGAGLHEFILQTIHNTFLTDQTPTVGLNAWLLILPAIALLGVWLVLSFWKHVDRSVVKILIFAGIFYVAGAAGVDILSNTDALTPFMKQGVLVAVEEGLELLGISLFVYACLYNLESTHGQKMKNAFKNL